MLSKGCPMVTTRRSSISGFMRPPVQATVASVGPYKLNIQTFSRQRFRNDNCISSAPVDTNLNLGNSSGSTMVKALGVQSIIVHSFKSDNQSSLRTTTQAPEDKVHQMFSIEASNATPLTLKKKPKITKTENPPIKNAYTTNICPMKSIESIAASIAHN
jgi:hypothetical protein